MQIGEKFSAPAVGGAASPYAMSTDAMPLVDRLAAHAAAVPVPRARDAGGERALAQSDALRSPRREPSRDRDLPCRRSPLRDREQATRELPSDAASQMAAVWLASQPLCLPDLTDGAPAGGASPVNDAEAGPASARVQEDDAPSADDDQRNALFARVAGDFALPATRSPSGQWRRDAAQAADTPADNDAAAIALTMASVPMSAAPMGMASSPHEFATTSNLRKLLDPTVVLDSQTSAPAIAPDSPKTSDRSLALNPMTTLDPAALAGQRAAPSAPAVGAASIGDLRADSATDRNDAAASPATPIEREGARQPSEGAPQQQMPVGSANDGLHTALYPVPSPQSIPKPTAASSPDRRPRPDPQAEHRPAQSPVASPTSHDAQVTRLSVPFHSWPSQSRVELSWGANDPGMPSIRMQPSSDGVRQALEQAWPTASAGWALDARDDGMPDRRHARSPQQDDEDEDNP